MAATWLPGSAWAILILIDIDKLLKSAGLVLDRAEGTRRIYRADPDGLRELRAQLDRFWNEALANFKQLVEQPEGDA